MLKRIETTYGEFYQTVIDNPNIDYYVETHDGELAKINAVAKKKSTTLDMKFSNGYELSCGGTHLFLGADGYTVKAEDLVNNNRILTTKGTTEVKSIKRGKVVGDVYDISIEAPHLYVNDEAGIIHHNTAFSLLMAKAFQAKYPDGVIFFVDTEFGSPRAYFESFGLDTSRILHCPVLDIEEMKFELMKQLDSNKRGDRVMYLIDSIGNSSSRKEKDDALEGKSVADMTRAKQLKSLFRMITPQLVIKDIPMVVVNHTYQELALRPRQIVGGGCMVAGTKIQLADGSLINIEDAVVDQTVSTLSGPKKITAVWTPEDLVEGTPECYKVTFDDGNSYTCSDQHLFEVDLFWVEVQDLKVGDKVSAIVDNQFSNRTIVAIEAVGPKPVYDISVAEVEHYLLDNGVASHNTGSYYAADNIFILGRQQEKEGTEVVGYNFIINVEKSRYVREKSKIPINVTYEGGISRWSGLLEIAVDLSYVVKPSNGWYSRIDPNTGEIEDKKFRFKDTQNKEFWKPLLSSSKFRKAVEEAFCVSHAPIISEMDEDMDIYDGLEEDSE